MTKQLTPHLAKSIRELIHASNGLHDIHQFLGPDKSTREQVAKALDNLEEQVIARMHTALRNYTSTPTITKGDIP